MRIIFTEHATIRLIERTGVRGGKLSLEEIICMIGKELICTLKVIKKIKNRDKIIAYSEPLNLVAIMKIQNSVILVMTVMRPSITSKATFKERAKESFLNGERIKIKFPKLKQVLESRRKACSLLLLNLN